MKTDQWPMRLKVAVVFSASLIPSAGKGSSAALVTLLLPRRRRGKARPGQTQRLRDNLRRIALNATASTFRSPVAALIGFVKADTFDNAFVYNALMGTGSTLAAFASLGHVSQLWKLASCDGVGLCVDASNTPQAVLDESLRIAIEGIDVRFTIVLRHDHGDGRELAVADVGSRSCLVGHARIASESGIVASLAVAPRAAITFNDRDWKPESRTSLVPAESCSPAQGPMPRSGVSHHA